MGDPTTNQLEGLSRDVRRALCRLYVRCLAADGSSPRTEIPGDVGVEVLAVSRAVTAYRSADPQDHPIHRAADGLR